MHLSANDEWNKDYSLAFTRNGLGDKWFIALQRWNYGHSSMPSGGWRLGSLITYIKKIWKVFPWMAYGRKPQLRWFCRMLWRRYQHSSGMSLVNPLTLSDVIGIRLQSRKSCETYQATSLFLTWRLRPNTMKHKKNFQVNKIQFGIIWLRIPDFLVTFGYNNCFSEPCWLTSRPYI